MKGGDFVSHPFNPRGRVSAPKGHILDNAGLALFRPAAALAASRLISLGALDKRNQWHVDTFVRGVQTVCELPRVLDDGTDVRLTARAILLAVANSGEVNRKRQNVLHRAHWTLAYRIMQWFCISTGWGDSRDTIVTYEKFRKYLDKGLRTAEELSA